VIFHLPSPDLDIPWTSLSHPPHPTAHSSCRPLPDPQAQAPVATKVILEDKYLILTSWSKAIADLILQTVN
jgi:hypothetical protein